MNLLPHHAHALGNHEFDDGPEGLAPYIAALNAPVVVANMITTNEPLLQGLYVPHLVMENQGRKIGIIGLITTDTAFLALPGNVEFTDPFEATKTEAEALAAEGVDIIVLLSHCGLDIDREIAQQYGQYIDIIVGGHTHSLLWNGEAPSGEPVDGTYPIIIQPTADYNHDVLIVQASAFTKYLGNLTVYFDERGEYVSWEGGPIFLDRSIPEDEDIKARLEPFVAMVREAESVVVGETTSPLSHEDCAYGECALGNMLVDAMNEHSIQTVQSQYNFVSLMQRGNILSSFIAGNITQGQIFELCPYDDRIVTFELQGSDVRLALEHSVMDAVSLDPFEGPWVLQVSGIEVTYNLSLHEGQRIVSADVNGSSLDDGSFYQVTTPLYLSNGADGFNMFVRQRNTTVIGRDESLLTSYIQRHTPLQVATEGRIRMLY